MYERTHSVIRYDPKKAYDGYTLIDPVGGKDAYLIDTEGRFVHHWKFAYVPILHSVLLPNGNLLRPMQRERGEDIFGESDLPVIAGHGGENAEVDWDGNLVWKWEDIYQNHTITRLSNGNTLILRFEHVPQEIIPEVPGGLLGSGVTPKGEVYMWGDSLQEITPDGEIAWEWKHYEHLKPEEWPICPLCARSEWMHANSIIEMPDGNIMMCCRHLSRIFIIDKKTGNIIWCWGEGELAHPHDPTLVGHGNILIYDNGGHRQDGSKISWSRALEVNLKTGKIEWEYRGNPPMEFYSGLCSGCQRLPNGNTLICQTAYGRVFEITPEGETVWEFINPLYNDFAKGFGLGSWNWVFRSFRYGPDYPGLKGKVLDPNNYKELNGLYGPDAFK